MNNLQAGYKQTDKYADATFAQQQREMAQKLEREEAQYRQQQKAQGVWEWTSAHSQLESKKKSAWDAKVSDKTNKQQTHKLQKDTMARSSMVRSSLQKVKANVRQDLNQ